MPTGTGKLPQAMMGIHDCGWRSPLMVSRDRMRCRTTNLTTLRALNLKHMSMSIPSLCARLQFVARLNKIQWDLKRSMTFLRPNVIVSATYECGEWCICHIQHGWRAMSANLFIDRKPTNVAAEDIGDDVFRAAKLLEKESSAVYRNPFREDRARVHGRPISPIRL